MVKVEIVNQVSKIQTFIIIKTKLQLKNSFSYQSLVDGSQVRGVRGETRLGNVYQRNKT